MEAQCLREKNFCLLFLAGLMIILVLYNYTLISSLFRYLWNNEDFSYGLLLPVVAVYIVYLKWPKISTYRCQPSFWGLVIMVGGMIVYVIGELAADLYVPRFSFIISLAGGIVLIAGFRLLRILLFPLLLLWLTIPLPELLTVKFTLPLQLLSSQLASWILKLLQVPVLRQGNIIDLGVRQLQVVDACSGLRYILALLALGVVFCYFFQRRPWKVAVLTLAMIPAAIFANALRLAVMAIYPIFLVGFWHAFSGWLIFIFCLAVLGLLNYLLNYFAPPQGETPAAKAAEGESTGKGDNPGTRPSVLQLSGYLAAALVMLLVFTPVANRAAEAPTYPLKKSLDLFPMQLDGWQGRKVVIDSALIAATGSQAHLNAEYFNPRDGIVSLWIAYYERQKKAGKFVHSPKGCFIASGWTIKESRVREIGPQQPIVEMIVDRTGSKLLIYYWYLQRGRWLADETWNKFYMAYDGMVKRRTDGALIRLITPLDGNLEQARERLNRFAAAIIPYLFEYIPD